MFSLYIGWPAGFELAAPIWAPRLVHVHRLLGCDSNSVVFAFLHIFSTLWWLTDCCMIYCPKKPKACSTSLCATITICCWRDFHLCSMLWTASHTIKTLTRSSVVWSWSLWTSGPCYHTFQWLHLNSCLSWDWVQTESGLKCADFLSVWFLGLCVRCWRWNWIRKRSQFLRITLSVCTLEEWRFVLKSC